MKVLKYPLMLSLGATVMLPLGAKVLTVQVQHDTPQLWALCDPDAPLVPRTFSTYGTGEVTHNEPGEYVATVQMNNGAYVFHVFEIANQGK